jgi:hypothetical protein
MSYRPLPKAQVKPMHVVHRKPMNGPGIVSPKKPEQEKENDIKWVKPRKKEFAERLTRNVAVAAALLLCAVAVRNAALPESKDVFTAIQDSVTMNLDESLGKLTFVSSLLPESALVFWNNNETVQVSAPVHGDIVHVFNEEEPYIALLGVSNDVRVAADGEVMNIAHGDGEERVIRIRHENGLETLYGNLMECYVAEGDQVYEGDIIGETAENQPVFFEVRLSGRSIDPVPMMREVVTVP